MVFANNFRPNQLDLSLNGPQILRPCYASVGPANTRCHPPVLTASPGLYYQKPTFRRGALTGVKLVVLVIKGFIASMFHFSYLGD